MCYVVDVLRMIVFRLVGFVGSDEFFDVPDCGFGWESPIFYDRNHCIQLPPAGGIAFHIEWFIKCGTIIPMLLAELNEATVDWSTKLIPYCCLECPWIRVFREQTISDWVNEMSQWSSWYNSSEWTRTSYEIGSVETIQFSDTLQIDLWPGFTVNHHLAF